MTKEPFRTDSRSPEKGNCCGKILAGVVPHLSDEGLEFGDTGIDLNGQDNRYFPCLRTVLYSSDNLCTFIRRIKCPLSPALDF